MNDRISNGITKPELPSTRLLTAITASRSLNLYYWAGKNSRLTHALHFRFCLLNWMLHKHVWFGITKVLKTFLYEKLTTHFSGDSFYRVQRY